MHPSLATRLTLQGKTALVTGASGGLGRQIALTLAGAGADLVLCARNQERLAPLVGEVETLGVKAQAVAMDIADPGSVERAMVGVNGSVGALDVVVNNAGVTLTKSLLELEPHEWDQVLDTNLRGAWLVAQAAVRAMAQASRPGVVLNIASILGERVAGGVAPYCASKAGLIHLTRAMALEWARLGVRCNALLPGYIATDLNREFLASEAGERLRLRIPTRRFGSLEDLDGPLLLLCSDAGLHITGTALAVDGGHLVSSL